MLRNLVEERMRTPHRARELLTFLRDPGSQIVVMQSHMTNGINRVLKDTDRVLTKLGRSRSVSAEQVAVRQGFEMKLVHINEQLEDLTAQIAAKVQDGEKSVQESGVRAALRKLKSSIPTDAASAPSKPKKVKGSNSSPSAESAVATGQQVSVDPPPVAAAEAGGESAVPA